MEFFRRVKKGEIDKERDVEEFLDRKAAEFEVRSRQVQMVESPSGSVDSDDVSDVRSQLPVLVKPKEQEKKKKKKKRIVVVKRGLSHVSL